MLWCTCYHEHMHAMLHMGMLPQRSWANIFPKLFQQALLQTGANSRSGFSLGSFFWCICLMKIRWRSLTLKVKMLGPACRPHQKNFGTNVVGS